MWELPWEGISSDGYESLEEAERQYSELMNSDTLPTIEEDMGCAIIEGKIIKSNGIEFLKFQKPTEA